VPASFRSDTLLQRNNYWWPAAFGGALSGTTLSGTTLSGTTLSGSTDTTATATLGRVAVAVVR